MLQGEAMNAPEKCPKCGADIDKTNRFPSHQTTTYTCSSMFNSSIGLTQASDCKKAELPFVIAERDALRAELAALKAERAGMVTREGSLLRFAGLILFAWFDDEIKGMHGDCFAGVIDFHLTDWAKQCGLMESIPEVYNRARATDLGKTALARAEAEAAKAEEKGGDE